MKILIADDSSGWRNFHERMLRDIFEDRVELTICNWAYEAYDKLYDDIPYNLIITDLQMEDEYYPKYAGEWLIERIKELEPYKNTPIVIVSATYNINEIADNYNVKSIRKSIASTDREYYKDVIKSLL